MSTPISLLAGVNAAYVQHLGVMLCSLYENNRDHRVRAHVLSDAWDGSSCSRLERLARAFGQEIDFIAVERSQFERFPVALHLDASTYYRILCAECLPAGLDRVLYLDSDVIVRGDLGELWATDLRGATVGAVRDSEAARNERRAALGLDPAGHYFNAGMLLIDLTRWRRERIGDRLATYIEANRSRLVYMDQDALNAVLTRDWHPLDPCWNRQEYHFVDPATKAADLLRDTAIIHYTGRSKPWHYLDRHPAKREYARYLSLTEWRHYRPPDRSPGNFLRKHGLMPGFLQEQINRRAERRGQQPSRSDRRE